MRASTRTAIRTASIGITLSIVLTPLIASPAIATATQVRVIRTSRWAKPSTDPSGLAFLPGRKLLIVCDSEVEETPHYEGANVWFARPGGRVVKTFRTTRFSDEPTDVTIARTGRILYFSDDNQDRIFIVRRGRDGFWGTADDVVSWFNTRLFSSHDPTGLGIWGGSLLLTDGDNAISNHRVYRIRPGPNHHFDGAPPAGDDVVTGFDTAVLGLDRPTDVVFDPGTHHLFIVGSGDKIIVEATPAGALVDTHDLSGTTIKVPAGITVAPGSLTPSERHVYVADRGVDNDLSPRENDGRIFEFALS
jgi:hypothetical protein